MAIQDFPGYLGWTSKGVIAIHADWPAYPREHGRDIALLAFGNFPPDTAFRCLDNIDGCALFVVDDDSVHDDYSENRFHVAIWHEDLLELVESRLIKGIDVDHDMLPQEIWRRQSLGEHGYQLYRDGATMAILIDGEYQPVDYPAIPWDHELLEEDEDEDHLAPTARLAVYEASTVSLTATGLSELIASRAIGCSSPRDCSHGSFRCCLKRCMTRPFANSG